MLIFLVNLRVKGIEPSQAISRG
ncbi:hypothetical protein Bhyg_17705 [Pseudolycoriella hygida]|uniref:Uncharacterized protein n=1 Tax=Pseudolycoriella hygida TaxID=35572 RepID=A0A9Q0MJ14_9DIPT|nr:hypothetical protein Bhyg_17705 [Pseudolycoriella hygida]